MLSFNEKYPHLVAVGVGTTIEDTLPGVSAEATIFQGAAGFFVMSVAAGRTGMARYLAEPVELVPTEEPNVFSATFPVTYPGKTGVEVTVTANTELATVKLSVNSEAVSKLVVAVAYGMQSETVDE